MHFASNSSFVCCILIVLENSFAERHDWTIFRVENSLVRQGKPVTIFTESESELFTGDTSKDNHSPGPVFREVSP